MKNFILNFVALAGFGLMVYGVFQISQPWASIVLGGGLVFIAIMNAIVSEYSQLKDKEL